MTLLIIPDTHGRKFWRQAITNNIGNVDKVIFLGDYLDPYPEEIMMAPELMDCNNFYDAQGLLNAFNDIIGLKKNEPDKYILLTGNHSDSYIWSKFHAATRTDYRHWEKYHKIFSENLNLFNLVYIQDNCIFSHAGISEGWANRVWEKLEFPEEDELSSVMEIAVLFRDTPLTEFNKEYISIISDIGYIRGGSFPYGSCEWADVREHIDIKASVNEIVPKGESGIYQIFGHSQLNSEPIITEKWACLDCKKAFIFDTITHECKDCL